MVHGHSTIIDNARFDIIDINSKYEGVTQGTYVFNKYNLRNSDYRIYRE